MYLQETPGHVNIPAQFFFVNVKRDMPRYSRAFATKVGLEEVWIPYSPVYKSHLCTRRTPTFGTQFWDKKVRLVHGWIRYYKTVEMQCDLQISCTILDVAFQNVNNLLRKKVFFSVNLLQVKAIFPWSSVLGCVALSNKMKIVAHQSRKHVYNQACSRNLSSEGKDLREPPQKVQKTRNDKNPLC